MADVPARRLGSTDFALPVVGLGTGPMGDLFEHVCERDAQRAFEAAWDSGLRYFDTAPLYGRGLSEHRLGRFLRTLTPAQRREAIVSTKVGRLVTPPRSLADRSRFASERGAVWVGGFPFGNRFDYTYDGIMRSWDDSLQRLGIDNVDMLVVHDLHLWHHKTPARLSAYEAQLVTSGWRALEALRADAGVRAIGAGVNDANRVTGLLELASFDFILMALQYTLLNQAAIEHDLPACAQAGISVVIGGVFNSGVLATDSAAGHYNYQPIPFEVAVRLNAIREVAARHRVPVPAAALQFVLAHPCVASVIPGAARAEYVDQNVRNAMIPTPRAFWLELRERNLVDAAAPLPGDER